MFTEQRLNQAYRNAQVIKITDASKFVFFSDTHRGNDSISDEFARNQVLMVAALRYYYNKAYTYVELGDGDELWEYGNFKHIRAAHTDIFTILKEFFRRGRLYMVYGNHNIYLKNKAYVEVNYQSFYDEFKEQQMPLFPGIKPIEALVLQYKKNGQKILALHGHQGDFLNDQAWILTMLAVRYFWRFMHLIGFRNPASPAKNQFKRHKIEKVYTKWIAKYQVALLCGHTHRYKFPKKGQYPFFNTGCGVHTKGISCMEIVNGSIMLVQWRIKADKSGVLRAVRTVIRGPKPLENFAFSNGKMQQERLQKKGTKEGNSRREFKKGTKDGNQRRGSKKECEGIKR